MSAGIARAQNWSSPMRIAQLNNEMSGMRCQRPCWQPGTKTICINVVRYSRSRQNLPSPFLTGLRAHAVYHVDLISDNAEDNQYVFAQYVNLAYVAR